MERLKPPKQTDFCQVKQTGTRKVMAKAGSLELGEGFVHKQPEGGYSIALEMYATNVGYQADDFDTVQSGIRHITEELKAMCQWYNKHQRAVRRMGRKGQYR